MWFMCCHIFNPQSGLPDFGMPHVRPLNPGEPSYDYADSSNFIGPE